MSERMHILDLNFLGIKETIPVYLFPHRKGVVLIESGPGSTLLSLEQGLKQLGYSLEDITDVFITHIHLDHVGAAGTLARHGAKIYLHPNGAPHMLNPEKLLSSAKRIYGEDMDRLWGEFLPIPEANLVTLRDEEVVEIEGLKFTSFYTPGHANHHIAYLFDDICFTGDVGGSRMQGSRYISMPMPPPEFHLETWRETVAKLRHIGFKRIAPTHYGVFEDVEWHLSALDNNLVELDQWLTKTMISNPPLDEFHPLYLKWTKERLDKLGVSEEFRKAYAAANPDWMSPAGLHRYWNKYRLTNN